MPEPYNSTEEKPFEPVDKIMLAEAVLCEDCTAITRAKNGHYLACSGHSLLNLAALLNRGEVKP